MGRLAFLILVCLVGFSSAPPSFAAHDRPKCLTFYNELDPETLVPGQPRTNPILSRLPEGLANMLDRPLPPEEREKLARRWQQIEKDAKQLGIQKIFSLSPAELERLPHLKAALEQIEKERGKPSVSVSTGASQVLANWREAEAKVREWALKGEPVTLERIKELNALIGKNTAFSQGRPGELRSATHANRLQGGLIPGFDFLLGEQVKPEMERFLKWYEESRGKISAPERAAKAYQWLVSIHPFPDGNGRTCRLVMDWILLDAGLPPSLVSSSAHGIWAREADVGVFGGVPEQWQKPPEFAPQVVTVGIERSLKLLRDAALADGYRLAP